MAGPRARQRRRLGEEAEARAATWYEQAGHEVLDRNWRCREGEIDLVCRSGSTLVICEVKARSSSTFGTPAEAVVWTKQRRLRRLAVRWLSQQRVWFESVRFDVACVVDGRVVVEHDAF